MLVDRHANLREIWIGLHLKGSKSRDRVTGAVTADVASPEKPSTASSPSVQTVHCRK